ncbi:hypothetical protein H6F44_04630 [Pseudanabaena sp. FACHB-1277]|uniref:Uncharacterized protein n=2 Tax=Pseudanabaena TaxID=1152 RepID=A0A926UQU1_9CYAN|nr:hypothetical protein [Pseudanabaena cinerea FACHB-1277]
MRNLTKLCLAYVLAIGLGIILACSPFTLPYPQDQAIAAERRPVIPAHGQPILSGNIHGTEWLKAAPESKQAYCEEAFAIFRGSAAQSYIISHNIQSLSPQGLCDRIDQYYSLEEYIDDRLGSAAAIAPVLFADTPVGTKY